MLLKLKIQRKNLSDLQLIANIDSDTLSTIKDNFNETKSPYIKPSELKSYLSELLSDTQAETLVRQLISLSSLAREKNVNAEVVIDSVLAALEKESGEDFQECTEAFREKSKVIRDLLESKSIQNVMKAIELSFDFDNFLDSSRIITDLRPLYDIEDVNISGGIITQTLRIKYTNISGSHSMSIAMDEKDINDLIASCKRALNKSKELKIYAEKSGIGRVLVTGEEKLE